MATSSPVHLLLIPLPVSFFLPGPVFCSPPISTALAHRRFEEDLRHRGHSSASGGICGAAPLASCHLTHSHTYSGSGTFLVLPSALYPHLTLSQISFHKSGSPRAAPTLSSHPHRCGSLLTVPFPPVAPWSFRASLHCGNFLSAQGSYPQPPLALWQSCCLASPSSLLYLCPFCWTPAAAVLCFPGPPGNHFTAQPHTILAFWTVPQIRHLGNTQEIRLAPVGGEEPIWGPWFRQLSNEGSVLWVLGFFARGRL